MEWEPEVVTKETSNVVKLKAEPGWLGEGAEKKKEIILSKIQVALEDGLGQLPLPPPAHLVDLRLIFSYLLVNRTVISCNYPEYYKSQWLLF